MSDALDVHLSEAQRDLYEHTRRRAPETLKPIGDATEPGRINGGLVKALADHGLLARLFGTAVSDAGGRAVELCLIREGLAGGCTDAETAVSHRLAELWARTETAQEAVDAAIRFHGARAREQRHPLEHLYRDVRAPRIYEGASEIQREIIARAMIRVAEAEP